MAEICDTCFPDLSPALSTGEGALARFIWVETRHVASLQHPSPVEIGRVRGLTGDGGGQFRPL